MTEVVKQNRGFRAMDPEKRRAIAARGGAAVPAHRRAFSTKPGLASSAGRKGGEAHRPSEKES